MNERLEKQLQDAMLEAATRAGVPAPLPRRALKRARRLQVVYAGALAGIIALAAVTIVSGYAVLSRSTSSIGGAGQESSLPTLAKQRVFLLDRAPTGDVTNGAVVAINIDGSSVEPGTQLPIGGDADFATSPDGSRLFAVSRFLTPAKAVEDRLSEFDSATGRLLTEVAVPHWQGFTGVRTTPKIAVSPDGGRVYLLVGFVDDPLGMPQAVATFDVASSFIAPNLVPLDGCGGAPAILPSTGSLVVVFCREVDEIRFIDVAKDGGVETERALHLDTSGATVTDQYGGSRAIGYVSWAAMSPDGREAYAVTRDGKLFVVDVASESVMARTLPIPDGLLVAVPEVALTADGSILVLGLGSSGSWDATTAQRLLAFDTTDWHAVADTSVSPFSGLALLDNGYAAVLNDSTRTLLVYDYLDGTQVASAHVGKEPMAVIPG